MLKYERQLVSYFANKIAERIVRVSIREFQKCDTTLSPDDSALENTWDEICVQIQSEKSFDWYVYGDLIKNQVYSEIQKLNEYDRFALWLQTDDGMRYNEDDGEDPEIIIEHICNHLISKVIVQAGDWRNKKIRDYFDY